MHSSVSKVFYSTPPLRLLFLAPITCSKRTLLIPGNGGLGVLCWLVLLEYFAFSELGWCGLLCFIWHWCKESMFHHQLTIWKKFAFPYSLSYDPEMFINVWILWDKKTNCEVLVFSIFCVHFLTKSCEYRSFTSFFIMKHFKLMMPLPYLSFTHYCRPIRFIQSQWISETLRLFTSRMWITDYTWQHCLFYSHL